MRRGVVCAAACWTTIAAAALAGPDSAATKRYASADRRVAVELPADWKAEYAAQENVLFTLRVLVPPDDAPLVVSVAHVPGFRNDRAWAYQERAHMAEQIKDAKSGVVGLDPLPHLVMDVPGAGPLTRHAWIFRVADRNGFRVLVYCAPQTWPAVKDACLRAAQSLTSKLEEWPARPDGFVASVKDGYEYLVDPTAKDADVAALHAAVLAEEKRYAVLHGPVPKPAANRPIVVVCPDRSLLPMLSGGAARPGDSSFADMVQGRLLATPLRAGDSLQRGKLALDLANLFHWQSVGCDGAVWLRDGESLVAEAEARLGKALPFSPDDFLVQPARNVVPFEQLVKKPPPDRAQQAVAYVALFRAGPQIYRDAFAAFLADLAADGDWEAAQTKRLLSLDQVKLRDAATSFVKEMRAAAGK